MGKKKHKLLKDLSGHSPLVNLFYKTKTKKITVVQYQNEKRREGVRLRRPPIQKQMVAQQQSTNLSSKSSLHPRAGDCPLEKLLLGVHEDVLVARHNLHSLPDLPDVGLCGRGHHSHGELGHFTIMVELIVPPECICFYLLLQPCLVLSPSGVT